MMPTMCEKTFLLLVIQRRAVLRRHGSPHRPTARLYKHPYASRPLTNYCAAFYFAIAKAARRTE